MRDIGPAGVASFPNDAVRGPTDRAPGKATLTEQIYRRADGSPSEAAGQSLREIDGAPGAPLPVDTRKRFETSSGADLSGVRLHTGAASARAAEQLGARAFTVGSDVHFAAGQYQPANQAGMHLLAHEVAHTVQQQGGTSGIQTKLEVSEPGDAAEVAADQFADHVIHGGPAPTLTSAPTGVIHRTPAAPTYGGVTGVRDLTKLTIDAISDFVASAMTAPRAVRAPPARRRDQTPDLDALRPAR